MSLVKSFVHAVMEVAETIHKTSSREREIVKQGAKNLAAAYTMDLFRAADFVVNVTKGVSGEAVMKIVMPASFEAIKATNEEFSKVDAEETQPSSPQEKPAFTLNEKGWATRPNPYIPAPTPCSPTARD